MTLGALLALAAAQALLAMSPGPATVLTIRTAAAEGVRAGLLVAAGLTLGVLVWAATALAGLSLVFEAAPWLQAGLRIAGGLFLIWVAVDLWRGARRPMPAAEGPARRAGASLRLGFLTNLANPKALAYFAAIFAGLMPAEPSARDGAAILAIVLVVEMGWSGLVAAVFSRPAPRRAYVRAKRHLERAFAGVMGALGLRLLADRA